MKDKLQWYYRHGGYSNFVGHITLKVVLYLHYPTSQGMFSKGLRFIKNERQNIFNLFLINQTTIKQLVNKYGELCYFMFNRRQLPSGRPDSSQLEFVLLHLLLLLILLPTSNSMRFFCNRENQYIFQDALGYVI